tara:strand:- start:137 stop:409 length:273 start_codon:yes stop_codon:yes gene_type:complete
MLPNHLLQQQGMFNALKSPAKVSRVDLAEVGLSLGNTLWPNEFMKVAAEIFGEGSYEYNHVIMHAMRRFEELSDSEYQEVQDGRATNQCA